MKNTQRLAADHKFPTAKDFEECAVHLYPIIKEIIAKHRAFQNKANVNDLTFRDRIQNFEDWKHCVAEIIAQPGLWKVSERTMGYLQVVTSEGTKKEMTFHVTQTEWDQPANFEQLSAYAEKSKNKRGDLTEEQRKELRAIVGRSIHYAWAAKDAVARVLEDMSREGSLRDNTREPKFLASAWRHFLNNPEKTPEGPFNPLFSEKKLKHSVAWKSQGWDQLLEVTRQNGLDPAVMTLTEIWESWQAMMKHAACLTMTSSAWIDKNEFSRREYISSAKLLQELSGQYYVDRYNLVGQISDIDVAYVKTVIQKFEQVYRACRFFASVTDVKKKPAAPL